MFFTSIGDGKWYENILQVLFENNYGKVYKTALSITLDEENARDAAQEAFIKAFLKIDTLKNKDKFDAWICSITVNVCRDLLRKKNTNINRNVSLYNDDGDIRDNIVKLSDFNTPETEYVDGEIKQVLLKCIGELDIDEQRIINMKYYGGLTYEEIAGVMGIKSSMVGMKLFRAKDKIVKKLKKYPDFKEGKKNGQGY